MNIIVCTCIIYEVHFKVQYLLVVELIIVLYFTL